MWLNLASFHAALHTESTARRVVYLTSTRSTMDIARREAEEGADDGTLVIAEEQSAGRGRFGRRWISPAGTNLYFTLALRPSPPLLRRLAIVSALAVCLAVEEVAGIPTQVKWPNDVQIGGRKLAGVLIESELAGSDVRYVLVGVGINVNYRIDDPEISDIATSLLKEVGSPVSREALLAAVMNRFEELCNGDPATAHTDWKSRLTTLGQAVTVRHRDETYHGLAEDVDAGGSLLLRTPAGELLTLEAGEVSLRA